jgi:ribosomal protein S18 acetylase RimI-like enzyme
MPISNFERLIQLADEVFSVKNDPSQLNVNLQVMECLKKIHPSTISEFDDDNGPVAWVLLIPTTNELMKRFIKGEITEKELFEQTALDIKYDALYLCSALVLEEYRRKGIVKNLVQHAIKEISKQHPITSLFVWPFSKEGEESAEKIARYTSLPLFKRE